MTDAPNNSSNNDILGMLQSELLSDEFKQVLKRIVELDGELRGVEVYQFTQLTDQRIIRVLERWYDPPTEDDFRIVE